MAEEWERLYRERFDRLVREADGLVHDRAMAEDLAQDAFLRLMQARLRDGAQAWAWLRVVVRNRAVDEIRRRDALDRAAPDLSAPPAFAESAESEALGELEGARVRQALGVLAGRDRKALWLRHLGASYRDIAGAVGIPENQVGVVLLRAMQKFRRAYRADSDREVGHEFQDD